ncbi:hypothetical protein SDJN02_03553, partial [Cucurbita argyrosperma subsp. argyrosperma]
MAAKAERKDERDVGRTCECHREMDDGGCGSFGPSSEKKERWKWEEGKNRRHLYLFMRRIYLSLFLCFLFNPSDGTWLRPRKQNAHDSSQCLSRCSATTSSYHDTTFLAVVGCATGTHFPAFF